MSADLCCKTGFRWNGTPSGSIQQVHGLESYVTKSANASGKHVLVFMTDIWSHKLINSQLLADTFADEAGDLVVYMPDLFDGELLDPSCLSDPEKAKSFDLPAFIGRHPKHGNAKLLAKYIADIRAQENPTTVGGVGYCYGATGSVVLAGDGKNNPEGKPILDYTATAHPSLLDASDIESVKAPALWLSPEHDFMYTAELKDLTQKRHGNKSASEFKYVYFPELSHGFAVRGNPDDAAQKAGLEKAKDEVVAWIKLHTGSQSNKL
ncbi:hypothetical protein PYCC9005_000042 [Savitreella phatthalungensis]